VRDLTTPALVWVLLLERMVPRTTHHNSKPPGCGKILFAQPVCPETPTYIGIVARYGRNAATFFLRRE